MFDKISARQVPFEMVRDILFDMTKAGGMFYNMQEVQAETLKGKVESLRDAYEKVLNTIGKTGGVLGAGVDITRALITNLDKFAKVLLGIAVTAYGIYNAALLVDNVTSLTLIGVEKIIAINALLSKSVVVIYYVCCLGFATKESNILAAPHLTFYSRKILY